MMLARKFFARIISAFIPNRIARRRVRGLLEFGVSCAVKVARQNRRMRNVQPQHYLTICAIAKNEGEYFKEWIEWHIKKGVEKFYIYDNESTDKTQEVLQPFIDSGLVQLHYSEGKKKQTAAYDHCLERYRYDTRWIAFIDLDEFIVPLNKENIPEFLRDFENYAAVEINWLCMVAGVQKHVSQVG